MTTSTKQFTSMDYKTITKNIKKITNKVSNSRPVLKHMYLNNNTIVATDSHRLLSINYKHDQKKQLIDPKTNTVTDSTYKYPETERIIPMVENANNVIIIKNDEIDLIISVLKAYKHLKLSRLRLSLNNSKSLYELNMNMLEIISENNDNYKKLNLTYQLENKQLKGNTISNLYLQVDYLLNAFEFLKDYDKTALLNNNYKIYIYDQNRPILITTDKFDFQYIICPIRENR